MRAQKWVSEGHRQRQAPPLLLPPKALWTGSPWGAGSAVGRRQAVRFPDTRTPRMSRPLSRVGAPARRRTAVICTFLRGQPRWTRRRFRGDGWKVALHICTGTHVCDDAIQTNLAASLIQRSPLPLSQAGFEKVVLPGVIKSHPALSCCVVIRLSVRLGGGADRCVFSPPSCRDPGGGASAVAPSCQGSASREETLRQAGGLRRG